MYWPRPDWTEFDRSVFAMLQKIKDWLNGEEASDPEILERQRAKAIFNLKKLQHEHCFIDVTFPERDISPLQSLILNVDSESNLLSIDELYPPDQISDVTAGEIVEVTSRKKGVKISFTTRIEAIDFSDEAPVYKLAIPQNVKAKQQRKNYRVQISGEHNVRLNIYDEPGLVCTIINLSANGLGFYIAGNHTDILKVGRVLKASSLRLPNQLNISCDILVRSIQFQKHPTRRTLIGAELSEINQVEQKKLENFIAELQREQRKSEAQF